MEERIIRRRGEKGDVMNLDRNDLPECLILEILYRMPLKTIFSSKSVSKAWLSLISDPCFAKSYAAGSRRSTWTLLYHHIHPWTPIRFSGLSPDDVWLKSLHSRHSVVFGSPSFTLRFLSDAGAGGRNAELNAPVLVLAASNGLLLSTATGDSHDCYYISNPLTKQWSALPKPPRIHQWVTLGFMVEPCDGSFQVMRIGGYEGSSRLVNFEIFSSKTGEWTDKIASFDLPVQLFLGYEAFTFRHAVSWNKILHWMDYNYRIITYDTTSPQNNNNETYTETIQCGFLDLPGERVTRSEPNYHLIGVCEDQLRYIQLLRTSQTLRVWKLRDNDNNKQLEKKNEWVLLHKISYSTDMTESLLCGQFLAFHPFNPHIVYVRRRHKLSSINLRTGDATGIRKLKHLIYSWTVFPFVLLPWPTPVLKFS